MPKKRAPEVSKGRSGGSETKVEDVMRDAAGTNFNDEAARKRFEEKHSARLNKQPVDTSKLSTWEGADDEVLHVVAKKSSLGGHEEFVRWLFKAHPQLLKCKAGTGGLTPLHVAICNDNHEFVGLVLETVSEVRELLRLVTDKLETCLHYAILFRSPFTEALIEKSLNKRDTSTDTKTLVANGVNSQYKVSASTSSSADDFVFTVAATSEKYKDYTALHIAVTRELEDTKDSIFNDMIATTTSVSSNVKTQNHSTQEGLVSKTQVPVKQGDQIPDQRSKDGTASASLSVVPPNIKAIRRVPTSDLSYSPTATPSGPPKKNLALLKGSKRFNLLDVVKHLIKANPRVLVDYHDMDGDTPFQARLNTLLLEDDQATDPVQYEIDRHKIIESDDILREMRAYIIDNFYRKDAMTALYKVGDERVLEFDLSGLPYSTIDSEFLKGLQKVLRFEGMLKYVALPRLTVKMDGGLGAGSQNSFSQSKGNGLRDMCAIFKWLNKCHVKKVLKVTVIDNQEPSHSDEAIEECVSGLDVRTWNWYKTDLCSEILQCVPNVRDVTLYSSGSNAVLLGWSSSAGLAQLKQLEKVHIYVQEGLETSKRREENMKTFETQLLKHNKDIKFTWAPHKLDQDHNNVFAERVTEKPSDSKWMKAMKDFAGFLRNDVKPGPNVQNIKIAVIDDGINTALDIFTGKIRVGESFYRLGELSGRRGAYYVPSGPHGTLMAELICQVLPPVQLYIAQLEVLQGQHGQRSFTAESAIDAIDWAVDQGVDIISMSWSINTNGDLPLLQDALDRAAQKRIIMFCASIDEGSSAKDNTYPGRHSSCIKIGACDGLGHKLSWVSEKKSRFLLPGDAMQPSSDTGFWTRSQMGLTGSSVSTALAAGLAGVLLYCDRLIETPKDQPLYDVAGGIPKTPDRSFHNKVYVDNLRGPEKMVGAFEHLSKKTEYDKFPQVWDYLPSGLKWNEGDENQDAKAALRKLMESIRT